MTAITEVLEAVAVRPGDTLVIRVRPEIGHQLLDEFVAEFAEAMDARAPGVKFLVVAADQLAVCRSGCADV